MAREIVLAADVEGGPKGVTDALTTHQGLAAFCWTPKVSVDGEALEFGFERAPDAAAPHGDRARTRCAGGLGGPPALAALGRHRHRVARNRLP